MTPENFCYWLMGYMEITEKGRNQLDELSYGQVRCIENHLNLVFHHAETTSGGVDIDKEIQARVDALMEEVDRKLQEQEEERGEVHCDGYHEPRRIMC